MIVNRESELHIRWTVNRDAIAGNQHRRCLQRHASVERLRLKRMLQARAPQLHRRRSGAKYGMFWRTGRRGGAGHTGSCLERPLAQGVCAIAPRRLAGSLWCCCLAYLHSVSAIYGMCASPCLLGGALDSCAMLRLPRERAAMHECAAHQTEAFHAAMSVCMCPASTRADIMSTSSVAKWRPEKVAVHQYHRRRRQR